MRTRARLFLVAFAATAVTALVLAAPAFAGWGCG